MNTTDIAPRLRLRHGSWNALRSVIAGERVPRSELRELWDLNVLDGTALTDPAQELLEGLTGMAGVVHVLGSDAGALRSASGSMLLTVSGAMPRTGPKNGESSHISQS